MGKPRDLANVVATGNILADGAVAPAELTGVNATAAEINILDGVTATAAELNLMDGVTATTAELNYVDGVTSNVQTQIDTKAPVAGPTFTGTLAAPTINASTALQIGGVAITATAAELNIMDGVTASASDLNGVAGINSNVQTQLNLKAPIDGATFTGDVTLPDKIVHTGDTNTAIRFPADDTVSFETSGSERFRVASAGQLGVAGANYGTSGQILTSGGSGAAPSWADAAGGGGQFDAVASGTIANGALVSLNSDGTVSVTSAFLGAEQTIGSDQSGDTATVYDTNSNKVVVCYSNDDESNRAEAVVGTVSGTSISFGSPTVITTAGLSSHDATFDSNSNKVVLVAKNGNDGSAYVGTVSGTSISFGSAVSIFTGSGTNFTFPFCTFDSNSNKVVVVYRPHSGGFTGRARVGTVSGTSISFGTEVTWQNSPVVTDGITFDSNSNKVVVVYRDDNDSNKGKARVGTVSGTDISFGSAVEYTSINDPRPQTVTFDSNSNKIVVFYNDTGNGNVLTANVGTVSGTSISFGSAVVADAVRPSGASQPAATFDTNLNKVVVVYADDGNAEIGKILLGTVSGTSISFGNPVTYNTRSEGATVAFDPDTNQVVIAYRDVGNSNIGTARMGIPSGIDNFFKWIGFASAAISNSATGTINVLGGINESQSSLEVGSTYYLTDAAALSTTIVSGREVGKALSATKILITQGSVT